VATGMSAPIARPSDSGELVPTAKPPCSSELPRNGSESHRALAQCGGVPSDLARLGNGQNPANPAEEACLTRFRYTTKDANR
jgi:hypothetical protein